MSCNHDQVGKNTASSYKTKSIHLFIFLNFETASIYLSTGFAHFIVASSSVTCKDDEEIDFSGCSKREKSNVDREVELFSLILQSKLRSDDDEIRFAILNNTCYAHGIR